MPEESRKFAAEEAMMRCPPALFFKGKEGCKETVDRFLTWRYTKNVSRSLFDEEKPMFTMFRTSCFNGWWWRISSKGEDAVSVHG